MYVLVSKSTLHIMSRRATYYCWDKELGKYGALAGRAHIAWHKIEKFCQEHHPKMLLTLRQVIMPVLLPGARGCVRHVI